MNWGSINLAQKRINRGAMHNIQLSIKPSMTLCLLLGGMSLMALVCIAVLPYPWPWKTVGCFLLVLASTQAIFQHGLRRLKHAIVALHINPDNTVQLVRKDGQVFEVRVMPSTVVTPFLSVLHCRLQTAHWFNRVQYLLIFADAVEADAYRRLRVYLRWAKQPAA